jgi:hypothetical protein
MAVVATGAGAGAANAADWLTAKLPSVNTSTHVMTATATMLGPQKYGTKLCVSLLQNYPYGPPIELASKCITSQGGSVSVSLKVGCGSYRTFASASYGNTVPTARESNSAIYCP